VDFLGSFNVLYDREAFRTAGGFDEAFSRASAEDNDLSYRLLDAGGKLRFTPHAIVKHFHPTRLGPYLRTQARHGFWRMRLYAKHPNRAYKGDRYAGLAELAAPALALLAALALCHAVLILIGAVHSPIGVALDVVFLLAYVLFRYSLPLRLAPNRGDARMLLFLPVLTLRDIVRGIGMLAGVVRFMVFARGMR
jgi:cellulose synthase/poly-beta-1,6-N-acetylglucosamine synthase-like glycosyltransferase